MKLHDWQSQFEAWLADNHSGQDAAHDIFHFRRVWMTAQKLSTDATVDWLVVLTACYFHDLVSLPKNHPERHHSSVLAALETRRVLMRDFPDFPQQSGYRPCAMPLRRTVLAPKSRQKPLKRKSCRMRTGLRRWGYRSSARICCVWCVRRGAV